HHGIPRRTGGPRNAIFRRPVRAWAFARASCRAHGLNRVIRENPDTILSSFVDQFRALDWGWGPAWYSRSILLMRWCCVVWRLPPPPQAFSFSIPIRVW